jgi:hypothetical protein
VRNISPRWLIGIAVATTAVTILFVAVIQRIVEDDRRRERENPLSRLLPNANPGVISKTREAITGIVRDAMPDSPIMGAVRAYLRERNRDVRILKVYPVESARGMLVPSDDSIAGFPGYIYFPRGSPEPEWAVRVEYETDQGFGDWDWQRRYFILSKDLEVLCDVRHFSIRQPGDTVDYIEQQRREHEEYERQQALEAQAPKIHVGGLQSAPGMQMGGSLTSPGGEP